MDDSVLIVSHNGPAVRQIEQDLTDAGFQVLTASDQKQAIDQLLAERPRLVVADCNTPNTDGLALCRAISHHKDVGFVYILVTMDPQDDDRLTEAFDAGASDCLLRPFGQMELAARLRAGQRMVALQNDLAERTREAQALHAEMAEANQDLTAANERLNELASTDELTGLPNRRTAMLRLTEFWSFSTRHGAPLVCILIDLDHFKAFNDTFGHAVGDLVLKESTRLMRSFARVEDVLCRIGGEEFLILCPQTTADQATVVAERHRRGIESYSVSHGNQKLTVTISAGVAERNDGMTDAQDLLKAADTALYGAKQAGRNCIYLNDQPVAIESASQSEKTSESGTAASGTSGLKKPTAMVIDHDCPSRDIHRSVLHDLGFRVNVPTQRMETINHIVQDPPDIIVLSGHDAENAKQRDSNLAGLTLLRQIKAQSTVQAIPVLYLGDRMDKDKIDAALEAGADEYMSTPVQPQELLLRVRCLCELGRSRQELLRSNEMRGEQARMLRLVLDYTRTLAATDDLDAILDQTVAVTAELTFSRRISIMLPDASQQYLTVAKSIGLDTDKAPKFQVAVGSGIAGRVFATRRSIVINSHEHTGQQRRDYESLFYASVPMITNASSETEPVVGVLNVSNRRAGYPFEPRELEFIDLISNIAASGIQEIRIRRGRDEARISAVIALANLAHQRHGGTGNHLDRVAQYCRALAHQLQSDGPYGQEIDGTYCRDLERAVTLHDIGKVAIPDGILLKPGKLTDEELSVMRSHVEVGRQTIGTLIDGAPDVRFLSLADQVAGGHHEWFDGSGYPAGLQGDSIPLAARIASVADAYDAITTQRSYKDASTHEQAIALIRERSGSQFEPVIVDAFLKCERKFARLASRLADGETVGAGIHLGDHEPSGIA